MSDIAPPQYNEELHETRQERRINELERAMRRMLFLHDNYERWPAQAKMLEEFPWLRKE